MALSPGVFLAKKKNGETYYRSSITFHNKHISLGSFPTEEAAAGAYSTARSLIDCQTRMTPEDYPATPLMFSKWVSLTNFINNGIYIKTPIYLQSNFFQYYLSQSDILLFDVDDLFYYSHHSIMRRGNHLFVADYGMQVNIASRYGIKSFAVPGRDFRFVNGNDHDYRYENIRIINSYNGVSLIPDSFPPMYLAKIHIKGDRIIGRYTTEDEAAIAYNKAADLLSDRGVTIRYTLNYLPKLSAAQYKEIYERVSFTKHFAEFIEALS
jgi:hypothetical protein